MFLLCNNVFSKLPDERQKSCVLILDEVYVKSMLQYHGGIVFGKDVNKPDKLANTIYSISYLQRTDRVV